MTPYVGITGFTKKSEVETALESLPKTPGKRKLMVGVLASSRTLKTNSLPNRYPKRKELGKIFLPHPRVLNLIHFSTTEPESLYDQLMEVRELAGPHCHGFQLNVAWPNPDVLEKLAFQSGQETVVVLQTGRRAMEMVDNSPAKLALKVATEYAIGARYILLDASGGKGESLNAEKLGDYLYALAKKETSLGLGIAGGLSPSTLYTVAPLIRAFANLSIDAEGRLRDRSDNLHPGIASAYLEKAFSLFDEVSS